LDLRIHWGDAFSQKVFNVVFCEETKDQKQEWPPRASQTIRR
jgi:hypothetical protein